jgi:hypothetical protein
VVGDQHVGAFVDQGAAHGGTDVPGTTHDQGDQRRNSHSTLREAT